MDLRRHEEMRWRHRQQAARSRLCASAAAEGAAHGGCVPPLAEGAARADLGRHEEAGPHAGPQLRGGACARAKPSEASQEAARED